jgi:hypothetical protein
MSISGHLFDAAGLGLGDDGSDRPRVLGLLRG